MCASVSPAGKMRPPVETSGGETREESGCRAPGRGEEEVLTEEEVLLLHPATPPLSPSPPPPTGVTVYPNSLPPAADPPIRIKRTSRLSHSTGTMNQTHLLLGTGRKPRLTPQTESAAGGVVGLGCVGGHLRRLPQSARGVPVSRTRTPQRHRPTREATSLPRHDNSSTSSEGTATDLHSHWVLPPLTPPPNFQQPIGKPLHPLSDPWSVNHTRWLAGLAPDPLISAASSRQWRSPQEEVPPPPVSGEGRAGRGPLTGRARWEGEEVVVGVVVEC